MAKKSKRLSKNRLLKASKLNTKRLGNKKRTKQRKPWKKRTMKGGAFTFKEFCNKNISFEDTKFGNYIFNHYTPKKNTDPVKRFEEIIELMNNWNKGNRFNEKITPAKEIHFKKALNYKFNLGFLKQRLDNGITASRREDIKILETEIKNEIIIEVKRADKLIFKMLPITIFGEDPTKNSSFFMLYNYDDSTFNLMTIKWAGQKIMVKTVR